MAKVQTGRMLYCLIKESDAEIEKLRQKLKEAIEVRQQRVAEYIKGGNYGTSDNGSDRRA